MQLVLLLSQDIFGQYHTRRPRLTTIAFGQVLVEEQGRREEAIEIHRLGGFWFVSRRSDQVFGEAKVA